MAGLGRVAGPLAFGVYSVTGMYGRVPRREAVEFIRLAWELGVEHFDTADVYGYGLGEELLREALGPRLREAFVATKVGYDFYSSRPPRRRFDPDYLRRALEASLRRLGLRGVDLVYLHNPTLEALRDPGVYQALESMVGRGAAGMAGVALGPEVDVLPHALEALRHPVVEAVQFVYNLLEQEPGYTIARLARRRGVAPVARVPHAGGLLDGSLDPARGYPEPRDHRSLRRPGWYRWALSALQQLQPALEGLPGTPGQRAIAFALSSLGPGSAVVLTAPTPGRLVEYTAPESLQQVPPSRLDAARAAYAALAHSSPEAPLESLRLLPLTITS